MDGHDWLRVLEVTAAPTAAQVEEAWQSWLAGDAAEVTATVSGLTVEAVRTLTRGRPPRAFALSSEVVAGTEALWFAVDGLTGGDGAAQPMAFLVPPRTYQAHVLTRATALVTRDLAATRPDVTPRWDVVERVDHETCRVMVRRGFLAWTFAADGEVVRGAG